MGGLIALGIVAALAMLPLGVRIRYDASGILVRVLLGPVKITVVPMPRREKKEKMKPKKGEKTAAAKQAEEALLKPPQPPKPEKPAKKASGGSLLDFLPLVKLALGFLGDFRRKLRLNNMEMKLVMAGGDPCDLAVNYGRAWAALGNLMPQLERLFVIKKRNIEVECDFTASETLITAALDLTVTLGRLLWLVLRYAVRMLCEFLKIKKKRKGGAAQ